MIKLGSCYFAEDAIAAIEPNRTNGRDYFLVHLNTPGDTDVVAVSGISEDDLSAILERAGLIPQQGVRLNAAMFPPEEVDELRDALASGYRFAGKDLSGQVYAYKDRPFKRGSEWVASRFDEPQTRRLHGEFDLLFFEDDEPLDLEVFFA